MQYSKKTKPGLKYEIVRNGRYIEHLELLKNGDNEYPELATALKQISWQEFEELFYRVGEVISIYNGGKYAGFYWVEIRGHILHLHSLVIKDEYRGRGIGGEVLKKLENTYRDTIDAIELGLHETNQRVLAFYQKEGFETKDIIEDIGLIILQKPLVGEK